MIYDIGHESHDVNPSLPEFRVETGPDLLSTPQSSHMNESSHEGDSNRIGVKRSADTMDKSSNEIDNACEPSSTSKVLKETTGGQKQKSTRGARACTNCHRLKMKCEVSENGGPCQRCARSGHECIFLESNRGRKSDKRRKSEATQQNLKKVEELFVSLLQNAYELSHSPLSCETTHPVSPYPISLGTTMNEAASSPQSGSATTTAISPTTVDMLVTRVQSLLSMERVTNDPRSIHTVAEQAAKFMQQMGMLEDSMMARVLDTSEEGLLKHVVRTVISGHTFVPHPPLSKPARSETMDSMQVPHLPDNTLNPLGLFAEASLQNWHRQQADNGRNASTSRPSSMSDSTHPDGRGQEGSSTEPENSSQEARGMPRRSSQYGVANDAYFHPSSMSDLRTPENGTESPPELLTEGIISSEEALELFRIFFHHCSLHMFLLDPEWHTPTLVCSRSPFLFTCVCAVASKFYTRRPDLYVQCQRRAIKGAFDAMSHGFKSPDIVQGFLLLTLYNQPVERYEEDRTWLFAGVAIRMAQDLNLHRKCVMSAEARADEPTMRDVLNRERTWYICFCVDRTLSAQMGKPYSIREDFLIRHASEWCVQRFSRPWDLGICALVDLLRVQTRQLDFLYSSTVTPSGLNIDLDYPAILPSFNEQLTETMQYWYRLGLDSVRRTLQPPLTHESARPSSQTEPQPHFYSHSHAPSYTHARPHPHLHTMPLNALGSRNNPPGPPCTHSETPSRTTASPVNLTCVAPTPHASHSHSALDSEPDVPHRGVPPNNKCGDGIHSLIPALDRVVTHLDHTGTADTLRASALLALHEAGPPADDADLATRSMYYIARQAPLRYNYAVLVLNSFGLQYALEHPSDGASADKPQYLVRCVHAAKEIIATVKCGMREILRYAPDPTFVAVAYACVFLLKLIRPVFSRYINEDEILALVNHTIEVLEEAAVDASHTPALYASFLRMLVESRLDQRSGEATYNSSPLDKSSDKGPRRTATSMDGVAQRIPESHEFYRMQGTTMAPPPSAEAGSAHDTTHGSRLNKSTMAPSTSTHVSMGQDPSLSSSRPPAMTVNPSQVNPMAAEIATRDQNQHPPSKSLSGSHHCDTNEHRLPTAISMPPLSTTPSPAEFHNKLHDAPGPTQDTLSDLHGWDALQYAKAQGVEVNRVLDDSFWTSLLPPGYGSGVVGSGLGSTTNAFDLNRDVDLFKPASHWGSSRAALTPGATRPSSPTLLHMPL